MGKSVTGEDFVVGQDSIYLATPEIDLEFLFSDTDEPVGSDIIVLATFTPLYSLFLDFWCHFGEIHAILV